MVLIVINSIVATVAIVGVEQHFFDDRRVFEEFINGGSEVCPFDEIGRDGIIGFF